MASSAEMMAGAMGLLVCTFIDALLYVVGNAILGPLTAIVNSYHITPLLGMAENSYVPYILWAALLLFEIGAILSFVYIVGRRQLSGADI